MPLFSTNPQRVDPYKNFKFIIRSQGQAVAAVNKISPLKRTTEVISFREGGDPSSVHLSPGQVKYEPITLEQGLTLDTGFEQWAQKVWTYGANPGSEVSLKDFRRDLSLDFLDEAGQVVITYTIFRCWPSEYTALPELDAGANAVAIRTLVLQTEGWQRDVALTPPSEPTLS